jgi:hypothetical protein
MKTNTKWCTYSWYNKDLPQHIGKVHNIRGNTCDIQYSEGQLYSRSAWDMDYVKVFSTLEDAIVFMVTNSNYTFLSEIKEDVLNSFLKDAKNVRWDVIPRYMKIKKIIKR